MRKKQFVPISRCRQIQSTFADRISNNSNALGCYIWQATQALEWTNRSGFVMDFGGDVPYLQPRDDNSLRVWEAKSQHLLLTIPLPYEMDALAVSSDGKPVAVAGTEIKKEGDRGHEIRI